MVGFECLKFEPFFVHHCAKVFTEKEKEIPMFNTSYQLKIEDF